MARHRDVKSVLHRNVQQHATQKEGNIRSILLREWPCEQKQQTLNHIPRCTGRQNRQERHFSNFLGQCRLQSRVAGVRSTAHTDDSPEKKWRLCIVRVWFDLSIENREEWGIVAEESEDS